jgi:hypothetical protein
MDPQAVSAKYRTDPNYVTGSILNFCFQWPIPEGFHFWQPTSGLKFSDCPLKSAHRYSIEEFQFLGYSVM